MRRIALLIGIVISLAAGALIPAAAQDDLSEEEQAMLEEVRTACTNWLALESYGAAFEQNVQQDIDMVYQGQSIKLLQTVEATGDMQTEMLAAEGVFNQSLSMVQTITQDMQGGGLNNQQTIGPITTEVIIVDGRSYMRMEAAGEIGAYFPVGWQDITEDASVFGMQEFDMNQLFQLSAATMNQEYFDTVLESTMTIEMLGEETLEGVPVKRYQLVLDISSALEAVGGAASLEQAFSQNLGIDVALMLDQIYDPERTSYAFEVAVGVEDQMVHEFVTRMLTDLDMGPELFTDSTLAGATVAMIQDVVMTLHVYEFNEPVTIEAPELGQ